MLKQLRNKIGVVIMMFGLLIMGPTGCSNPKLPDPTIEYPKPPAALMEPSRNMQEIPTLE